MKIWLLAENWPPRQGGIENYLWHVAEYCGRAGHEVVVIAPRAVQSEPDKPLTKTRIIRRRFYWFWLRPKWLPLRWYLRRQLLVSDRPDVIFCGKALFEGQIGRYFYHTEHIPYVVFTYGMEINTWSAQWRWRGRLQQVLGNAKHVVRISDAISNRLRELGTRENQLLAIAPGVDERYWHDISPLLIEETKKLYKLRQSYIISVGRLVPRKGFDALIAAFSQLDAHQKDDTLLVIIGQGPDELRLREIITDKNLEDRVIILPNVPDRHLPALYAGAKLFALTPRDIDGDIEGFGIVYLEAAAMALPTVATATGGVRSAVIHKETGLVVQPTVEDIAQALETLLHDEKLRLSLGTAGRARVRREFDWSAKVQILLDALNVPPQAS